MSELKYVICQMRGGMQQEKRDLVSDSPMTNLLKNVDKILDDISGKIITIKEQQSEIQKIKKPDDEVSLDKKGRAKIIMNEKLKNVDSFLHELSRKIIRIKEEQTKIQRINNELSKIENDTEAEAEAEAEEKITIICEKCTIPEYMGKGGAYRVKATLKITYLTKSYILQYLIYSTEDPSESYVYYVFTEQIDESVHDLIDEDESIHDLIDEDESIHDLIINYLHELGYFNIAHDYKVPIDKEYLKKIKYNDIYGIDSDQLFKKYKPSLESDKMAQMVNFHTYINE